MLTFEPLNQYHSRLRLGGTIIGHIVRRHALEWAWFLQIPIDGGVAQGAAEKKVVASAEAIEAASVAVTTASKNAVGLALQGQRYAQARIDRFIIDSIAATPCAASHPRIDHRR